MRVQVVYPSASSQHALAPDGFALAAFGQETFEIITRVRVIIYAGYR